MEETNFCLWRNNCVGPYHVRLIDHCFPKLHSFVLISKYGDFLGHFLAATKKWKWRKKQKKKQKKQKQDTWRDKGDERCGWAQEASSSLRVWNKRSRSRAQRRKCPNAPTTEKEWKCSKSAEELRTVLCFFFEASKQKEKEKKKPLSVRSVPLRRTVFKLLHLFMNISAMSVSLWQKEKSTCSRSRQCFFKKWNQRINKIKSCTFVRYLTAESSMSVWVMQTSVRNSLEEQRGTKICPLSLLH